jgi:hypothetical protein
MENAILGSEPFKQISLSDTFFDSLKEDYGEFAEWFRKKSNEKAFTFRNEVALLEGFLYVKVEDGPLIDTIPQLPHAKRLKIGTFKVNPHGTRLGERFIKRAFDIAVDERVSALYVTVFAKHVGLVNLFHRYGFVQKAIKKTTNGVEQVMERRLDTIVGDVVFDYPRIPIRMNRHFALSVYPIWHSRLLPDSLLKTEKSSILQDVSHTNSIHKIYLTAMSGIDQLQRGDTLMIYRTAAGGSAYYTSVVTSLCVVEELKNINSFTTEKDFLAYCAPYSIFSEDELGIFYRTKKYPWIIRFTYNLALQKRLNRKTLLENVGLDPNTYWGFFPLSTDQLNNILKLSGDYEKACSLVYSS